jgi:riboflavin synthase
VFTGIVTHRGRILAMGEAAGGSRRILLEPTTAMEEVRLGASVAVDGVCLTVSHVERGGLAFDVVPETLRKTTLGERAVGDLVNLERALRVGDELGGHWVQGHVEGCGEVVGVERRGDDVRLSVAVSPALLSGVIPKGSVTLDGVSLTVGEVEQATEAGRGGRFGVYLVPHTLAVTGLGGRRVGDRVNVEPDVLGRWVEHHVRRALSATDGEEGAGPRPPVAPWRSRE